MTNPIPKEDGIDHSISLIREGYMFIPNRCRSFNSKIFMTRLLGKKTICMVGKAAAEIFYDNEKFKRKGVAPNRVIQTLFGQNAVQTLDGASHENRKEMLMSVMTKVKLQSLTVIASKQWEAAVEKWQKKKKVVLYEEVQELLCRTACEWVGVPVEEDEIKRLSKDLASLFESAGATGPNHWFGRNARNRIEKWLEQQNDRIRDGEVSPPEHTPLHTFTSYRDLDGNLLDSEIVAVEIINLLRPIVAISIYISFIAHALYHYPDEKRKLISGNEEQAEMFVQEVRRFYPFFPFAIAQVNKDFIWNGYVFEKGTNTLLDIYGTNHDPDVWDQPNEFHPNRFKDHKENSFNFIPQGGGDYFMGHRCAGEWLTIEMMKVSLHFLANKLDYDVPEQDFSYSMVSMPSIPKSKVIIQNVTWK